jgi:hypothetical protein
VVWTPGPGELPSGKSLEKVTTQASERSSTPLLFDLKDQPNFPIIQHAQAPIRHRRRPCWIYPCFHNGSAKDLARVVTFLQH